MGLLAGVVVLLLGLGIKTCFSGRTGGGLGGGKGYKALKDPYPPQHDRPYTSEAYTTPYADGGH